MKLQPATRLALDLREPPTRSAVATAAWRLAFGRDLDTARGQGGDHATALLSAIVEAVEVRIADRLPSLGLCIDTGTVAESIADALVPELSSQRGQLCAELGIEAPAEPLMGQMLRAVTVHVATALGTELLPIARAQRGPSTQSD
jgi:hypothetical protein